MLCVCVPLCVVLCVYCCAVLCVCCCVVLCLYCWVVLCILYTAVLCCVALVSCRVVLHCVVRVFSRYYLRNVQLRCVFLSWLFPNRAAQRFLERSN